MLKGEAISAGPQNRNRAARCNRGADAELAA